jgi:predicted CXXCH cytochrome family protein
MNQARCRLAWLALAGVATLGTLLTGLQSSAADSAAATNGTLPVILGPADGSAGRVGQVQVIAVGQTGAGAPALRLDGQPQKLEPLKFAPTWLSKPPRSAAAKKLTQAAASPLLRNRQDKTLWTTVVSLSPGEHALELDAAKTRLMCLASPSSTNAPSGWTLWYPHPSPTKPEEPIQCASCHDVKPGDTGSVIGRAKPPQSCFTCHNEVDLRLTHSHVLEPLANCLMCHDPHGSPRPKLLIDTREKLCTQCHEAGHSTN